MPAGGTLGGALRSPANTNPVSRQTTTMKPTCALAYVLLTSLAGVAQTAPSTNGVERVPSAGATAQPVSVPVPVVRVPVGGVPVPAEPEKSETRAVVVSESDAQLGWSSTSVGLREPSVSTVRTNRGIEMKGVLPRAARSERRGFGGFLAGFANLFNPLAPVAKGVETRGEHWYDGGVQSIPLPRGMRDERSHEPQTAIFSTEFGRGEAPDTVAPSPAKGTVGTVPGKP